MKKLVTPVILSTFLFVRLWKVPELFNFTFSEEMQAFMAWEQVKNFHPIWIGVSAANINYYLGPGFTYLNAFLFMLSHGDPAILAYASVFIGLATVASMYFVVQEFFSKKVALYSIIIYGCSTLINLHDRRFWNPTPIPFITVWMIYSLIKAQKDTRWFILTAALMGMAFHTHLTLLLFLVPAAYVLFLHFKKVKLPTWIGMVGVYLLITSPLIIFDINHNYDNFLMPVRTFMGTQHADVNSVSLPNMMSHVKELLSAFARIWFIKLHTNPQDEIVLESHLNKTYGSIFLSFLTVFPLVWFFLKNRARGYQIFFITMVTIITVFIIYPSYNPEYYLMSLLAIITVVIGWSLARLPRFLSGVIVAVFIAVNVSSVVTLSQQYGLVTRKELIQKTMEGIGDRSFELQTFGEFEKPHFTYAGWRYLFKAYGRTPAKSNVDVVLGWIYPDEIAKKTPELLVVIADSIEPQFDLRPVATYKSGPFRSYIFENHEIL